MTRVANIDQSEVNKAFARADSGKPTLMGIASHDFRHLGREVEFVRGLIDVAAKNYPGVKFRFSSALEAFRRVIWPGGIKEPALQFEVNFQPASASDVASMEIITTQGKVFGPQPFLAIQTQEGRVFQDNLDFGMQPGQWSYAFHPDTILLEDVKQIGVAANDQFGNICIKKIGEHELRGGPSNFKEH